MLKRVLLPEPDGPMMARYSPRNTSMLTPRSACTNFLAAIEILGHVNGAHNQVSLGDSAVAVLGWSGTTERRRGFQGHYSSTRNASTGRMRAATSAG